jgi:signal peptidase I
MEPAIMTGSLVVVVPKENYQLNEVVTFKSTSAEVPTTHRIVNIEEREGTLWFTTKGDANEEADTAVTPLSSLIGKVVVAVPYVGFVLDFARQPLGFTFLIVLPALMIIFGEIEKIWKEIRKKRNDEDDGSPVVTRDITKEPEVEVRKIIRMIEIGRPVFSYESIVRVRHLSIQSLSTHTQRRLSFGEVAITLCAIITSVCFASLNFVGSTVSYFNDVETSEDNTLTAIALDFGVEADGSTYTFLGSELDDVDGAVVSLVTPVPGSADVQYTVTADIAGGSVPFCESILVDASLPALYTGPLLDLSLTDVTFDAPWSLGLSLVDGSGPFLSEDMCVIDITYTAHHVDGVSGEGYSDEEKVTLAFRASVVAPKAFSSFSVLEESDLLSDEQTTSSTTESVTTPSSPESDSSGEEEPETVVTEEVAAEESEEETSTEFTEIE